MLLVTCFKFLYYQPIAVVLPHHNLVQSTRQDFLKLIAKKRLVTRHIVLLSPDHFGSNQHQIISSSHSWDLSTGTAVYNNFLRIDLPQDNNLLQNDHGIYNPLADLKTYFPQADYYPVLIGQKTTPQELQTIRTSIEKYCSFDCLLVASVDFSHYLPATLANVHDAYTINNLRNLDSDNILKSEVDSPQSLYTLISFALHKSAHHWHLFDHTNSGIIAHNPDIETTTHVFGYYTRGRKVPGNSLSIVHLPQTLNRSQNQTTLGDRFFYGVDNLVVDSPLPGFVISQITTPSQISKSFLPIKNNSFLRRPEKQQLIKQYFDSVRDSNVTKDYFWGTLIYESKSKSPTP